MSDLIRIAATTNTIGLYLSGGVESSLLLYLLSKLSVKIKCYTIIQQTICTDRINNIVNWINTRLNTDISTPEKIYDKDSTSDRTFTRWIQLYLRTGEVDQFVIGSNKFMPSLPEREFYEHPHVLIPFRDMYKHEVVQLYRDENIWELLELTHSCYVQKHGHCETCLNCLERSWAINY